MLLWCDLGVSAGDKHQKQKEGRPEVSIQLLEKGSLSMFLWVIYGSSLPLQGGTCVLEAFAVDVDVLALM